MLNLLAADLLLGEDGDMLPAVEMLATDNFLPALSGHECIVSPRASSASISFREWPCS